MATTTSEQIVREAPDIEAYKLGLLQSAKELVDTPVNIPAQQIAGMSQMQQDALTRTQAGVGAYEPYLQELRQRAYEGEEVETVKRWELVRDASVACHKCWTALREKTFLQVEREVPKWVEEPLSNSQRIKSFLTRWVQYGFGEDEPNEDVNKVVEELKESVRRSARGE